MQGLRLRGEGGSGLGGLGLLRLEGFGNLGLCRLGSITACMRMLQYLYCRCYVEMH